MDFERLVLTYDERIDNFKLKESKLKQYLIFISVLRFLFFVLFITSIVYLVKQYGYVRLILSVFLFSSFVFSVVHYLKKTEVLNHFRNLIKINEDEKKVLFNDYSEFYEGEGFIDREHAYSYDLDLFGKGSLYQYLNRTVTFIGRDLLAKKLLKIANSEEGIEKSQEACTELSNKLGWRQNFLATGYACPVTKDDNTKIDVWLDKPVFFIKKVVFKILVVLLPLATLISLGLLIFGHAHYTVFTTLGIIQLFFASAFLRRSNKEQQMVSEELRILKNYSKLIYLIENESFASQRLIELQYNLRTENVNAKDAFKILIRIIDAFDTRLNIFLGVILNATLMWDLYSIMRLERWKVKYGENVKVWVKVIAEFDVFCSMSNFKFNNPEFTFPKISDETVINARDIGHPLIHRDKRINNDFTINKLGQIDIVTGANMAGKSTFLRTIGVNMILAMNGMPVCASSYSFKIVDLFSGMRTADSLSDNESYFYAELKRLKYIIEKLKQGEPTLVLLDEILKGTNSLDKAKGSWEFVEHLILLRATGIVATHDLTLCEIEKDYPNNISNKCFEVEINGQNISFDYKLKFGITKNMNASLLMKQMGLFKK